MSKKRRINDYFTPRSSAVIVPDEPASIPTESQSVPSISSENESVPSSQPSTSTGGNSSIDFTSNEPKTNPQ